MRRPLLFMSFCLVALIALINYRWPAESITGPPDGTQVIVTGQICDRDNNSFDIKILEVLNDAAFGQQNNSNFSKRNKLIISYEGAMADDSALATDMSFGGRQEVFIGAVVTVQGSFYNFTPATNPGEFDYAKYYHSIGYLGRVKDAEVLALSGKVGVCERLFKLRMFWKERLYHVFPEREASVMAAILLGEKSDVDEEIRALYERNGIVHILSISGLHITIIGMGLYKFMRKLGMPVWMAALGGAAVLVLYGMMTGFGVSVCRAVGMYLLRMLGLLWGRTYDMLTALGFVGMLMAIVHPAWLGHMGYLLSFGSVLGLGLLLPALSGAGIAESKATEPKLYVEGRIRRGLEKVWKFVAGLLREGLLAGVSITITTLPIQLWFNYEISVYSVFLNALILPLMSAVMVTGLVAMLVPGLGLVGTVDVIILTGYEGLCHIFESLPVAMWNPGRPAVWQVAVYYFLWSVVVWGVPWMRGFCERNVGGRQKCGLVRAWGVLRSCRLAQTSKWLRVQIGFLAVAVGVLAMPRFSGDRVTFLDVGQGDCICVQLSGGEVYLFDCGSSSRRGIGENVLIPFLKYYGISEIEAVFASHGDADHTNGLEELLLLAKESHIEVGQLVLPYMETEQLNKEFEDLLIAAYEADVPIYRIATGGRWSCKEDMFMCLHPEEDDCLDGNAGSECFYVELQEDGQRLTLLLTGDVEGEGEDHLTFRLREQGIYDVDVLKVAHHGSRNSTSDALLAQINPQVAVISCGRKNSYGHPHKETLERLESVGATIVNTSKYGAITVELGAGCEIKSWSAQKE